MIRDATVLTREFYNKMVVLQFEEKKPLLAYSEQFVRKGSVMSFAANYQSQGRKAAELVISILEGKDPSEIPIQPPKGELYFNAESAEMSGVKIFSQVLRRKNVKIIQGE